MHGDKDLSIAEFDKALEADKENEHPEIAKEASQAYEKWQNYPDAIRMYERYLDGLKGGQEDVSDLFLFGRLYYMAAGSLSAPADSSMNVAVAAVDTIQKKAYLAEADTIRLHGVCPTTIWVISGVRVPMRCSTLKPL